MSYSAKPNLFYIVTSLLISININTASAEEKKDAPLLIPGTTKVLAEEVLDLAEKTLDLIVIDARIISDRRHGYIQDSISLPDIETDCESLAKIIPKKTSAVLFYCNGIKCGRSVKSSNIAIKCGYENIYWFRGGFEEWKTKNFPFIKS